MLQIAVRHPWYITPNVYLALDAAASTSMICIGLREDLDSRPDLYVEGHEQSYRFVVLSQEFNQTEW